jgi:hypothetical protein
MRVATAQLPGPDQSADRVFVLENAVIVLDGASAFEPVDLAPGDYAQALGESIAAQLAEAPHFELPAVVAKAIAEVVAKHDLRPGASPSSTVSILRTGPDEVDLYVLGDSPIHYGNNAEQHALTDNRLAELQLPERDAYRSRLRGGHGYDDEHRRLLRELQRKQRTHRNREGGYWIAETEPGAARQARTVTLPSSTIAWAVLATDGAGDVLAHLDRHSWPGLADGNADQLLTILHELHDWEEHGDPAARRLPRAKRHDDKTIAAVHPYGI